jgi:hypothetical protein
MSPIVQLDATTAAALITAAVAISTAIISDVRYNHQFKQQEADRYAQSINDMADAQKSLQDRLNSLTEKVDTLYDTNFQLEETVHEYQQSDIVQVEYIREIGHWLNGACGVMRIPKAWVDAHPKPKLPESLRSRLPEGKKRLDDEPDKEKMK